MARRNNKPVLSQVWPSHWHDEPARLGKKAPNPLPLFAQYQFTPPPAPAVKYSEHREAEAHRKYQDAQARGACRETYILVIAGTRTEYKTLSTAIKAYVAAACVGPELYHVGYYGHETRIA